MLSLLFHKILKIELCVRCGFRLSDSELLVIFFWVKSFFVIYKVVYKSHTGCRWNSLIAHVYLFEMKKHMNWRQNSMVKRKIVCKTIIPIKLNTNGMKLE